MPTNKTNNYSLSQWAANDRVLREDFNADNAKIDAALKQLADQSASLSGSKADQTALNSEVSTRTSQVNAINAKVSKLGNCQIYHTSYVGDGEKTRTLTFPKKPYIVFIMGAGFFLQAMQGYGTLIGSNGGSTGTTSTAVWSGNSLTWTFVNGSYNSNEMGNTNNVTYRLVALMDAGE